MKHGVPISAIREQGQRDGRTMNESDINATAARIGRYYSNNYGKAYREAALAVKEKDKS